MGIVQTGLAVVSAILVTKGIAQTGLLVTSAILIALIILGKGWIALSILLIVLAHVWGWYVGRGGFERDRSEKDD